MKTSFFSLSGILLLTACQQIDLGDYANIPSNDDTYEVNITSKSGVSGVDIPYPLTVYAVNEDGLVEDKASTTESGSINLSLLSGDFTFYAIAGADAGNSDVPANNIVTTEEGYFANAVMRGETNKTIDDNEELSLTLSNAVASVDATLSNIPANVQSVSVKIATLRQAMNLEGEYDGNTTATIDLEKQPDGTTWKSATVYVFPSVSTPTTLTITHTLNDNTTKSYTASYNSKLLAGTPYHFKGTGTNISNHELTVNVTAEGWDDAIEEELTLTPIESGDGSGTIDSDGETYYVSEIPTEAGTVLDGKYILAYVEGNQGLLYAKKDCAIDDIANYKENGITGWSVPTLEQYNKIKSSTDLNKLRKAIDTINNATKKADKYQYNDAFYCNDCSSAFSWINNANNGEIDIDTSGKTYHLRLVKPITFKIQQ